MEVENDILLSLGSNLGNREQNIKLAISKIETEIGKVQKVATNLENEAQGFESQTQFLNTVVQIKTTISPMVLLEKIKKIELDLGRKPKKNNGYESRCIDIDIILFDNLVFNNEFLTIPHKNYRSRDFVLIPLSEIAPTRIDPITCLTSQQLLNLLNLTNVLI